jgi:hypothetical protein
VETGIFERDCGLRINPGLNRLASICQETSPFAFEQLLSLIPDMAALVLYNFYPYLFRGPLC